MKTYKIFCTWEMCGNIEVTADSLDEALAIAEEEPNLPNGEYIQGSFQVEYDELEDVD